MQIKSLLDMKITIRRFLLVEIVLIVIVNFFTISGILPNGINYIFDIINIILLILSANFISRLMTRHYLFRLALYGYLAFCIFSAIFNAVNPLLFFWEFLQVFRLLAFGLLFATHFSLEDFVSLWRAAYKLQWLNLALVLFQFFSLGLTRDRLGGVFGTDAGCNGPLNVYLAICSCYAVVGYLHNKVVKFSEMVMTGAACLVIASMSEIKFFYFEFVLIVLISLLIIRPSIRAVGLLFASILGLYFGLSVLQYLNPYHFSILTDFSSLIAEANNSNLETGYGVSRLNVFGQLQTMFFGENISLKMFGMGFGSATMSSLSIFCSSFYKSYGYLGYYYLSSAMLFLQTGYIGVFAYIFISLFPTMGMLRRKNLGAVKRYAPLIICVAIVFAFNLFYDNTARIPLSFMWSMFLFAPYAQSRTSEKGVANE